MNSVLVKLNLNSNMNLYLNFKVETTCMLTGRALGAVPFKF